MLRGGGGRRGWGRWRLRRWGASGSSQGVVEGARKVGELGVGEGLFDLIHDFLDPFQGDVALAEEIDHFVELLGEKELGLAEIGLDFGDLGGALAEASDEV